MIVTFFLQQNKSPKNARRYMKKAKDNLLTFFLQQKKLQKMPPFGVIPP
jgi:hypothetical protein